MGWNLNSVPLQCGKNTFWVSSCTTQNYCPFVVIGNQYFIQHKIQQVQDLKLKASPAPTLITQSLFVESQPTWIWSQGYCGGDDVTSKKPANTLQTEWECDRPGNNQNYKQLTPKTIVLQSLNKCLLQVRAIFEIEHFFNVPTRVLSDLIHWSKWLGCKNLHGR